VSVINPPGISVLENHGLMAFIQNACKFYWKNRYEFNRYLVVWAS
jgi:hypothetical protein